MDANLILIVGMGRSGTSFLSRSLNLNGLYLGEDTELMIPRDIPTPDNPLGHWENWNVYTLNHKLMELNLDQFNNFQRFVHQPPNFHEEAFKIIDRLQRNGHKYGWKDPLMLYTFDIWFPVLPKFHLVGIFRNPSKVITSSFEQNGKPSDITLGHWLFSNKKLLELLDKHGGYLINFDWPKETLSSTISHISKTIGLTKSGDIDSWFHDSLKRSDITYDKEIHLPNEVLQIWNRLEEYSLRCKVLQ